MDAKHRSAMTSIDTDELSRKHPHAYISGGWCILDFPSGKRAITVDGLNEMGLVGLDAGKLSDVLEYLNSWGDSGLYRMDPRSPFNTHENAA